MGRRDFQKQQELDWAGFLVRDERAGPIEILSAGERPDVLLRDQGSDEVIGLEVTEVLHGTLYGLDRSIESEVCRRLRDVLRDRVGPTGSVTVALHRRPPDEYSIVEWMDEFGRWIGGQSKAIDLGRQIFPDPDRAARASMLLRIASDIDIGSEVFLAAR